MVFASRAEKQAEKSLSVESLPNVEDALRDGELNAQEIEALTAAFRAELVSLQETPTLSDADLEPLSESITSEQEQELDERYIEQLEQIDEEAASERLRVLSDVMTWARELDRADVLQFALDILPYTGFLWALSGRHIEFNKNTESGELDCALRKLTLKERIGYAGTEAALLALGGGLPMLAEFSARAMKTFAVQLALHAAKKTAKNIATKSVLLTRGKLVQQPVQST